MLHHQPIKHSNYHRLQYYTEFLELDKYKGHALMIPKHEIVFFKCLTLFDAHMFNQ